MGQLNDYLGFFDKVQKRLRNEDVTQAFAELFAQRVRTRLAVWTSSRGQAGKDAPAAAGMQKTYQFKNVSDVVLDEEHKSYSVSYTDAQGAVRTIDWRWPRRRRAGRCWRSMRRSGSSSSLRF